MSTRPAPPLGSERAGPAGRPAARSSSLPRGGGGACPLPQDGGQGARVRRPPRRLAAALAALAALAVRPASAQDGAYGRLDGDLALSLEAGAALGDQAAPAARLGALYLDTAGLYLTASGRTGPAAPFTFGAGVELRPLFVPRFFRAYERGPAFLDLALDSLSLRLGARRDAEGAPPSLEVGLGAELPLAGRYDGPFVGLSGSALVSHDALAAESAAGSPPRFLGLLTLGWRLTVGTHLVDLRDERER
ncbi:MAG TPA: hypothetical protein VFS43_02965 [Polyangiaceae bacterium]|nr:hypothetical protein [Polyangiaceae bacterium]